MSLSLRWVALGIFVLSSALNYLDRQILGALAPVLKAEFGMNNRDFGYVLSVFSITYAISCPFAGLFLDRFGLTKGMSVAVGFWSLAGMARGLVTGFPGLLFSSAALGIGEAAGIPSTGKAGAIYLQPKERALGGALSQIGLSVGSIAALPMATYFAVNHGWRWAFIVPGLLGFLWIPLWHWIERKAPKSGVPTLSPTLSTRDLLREKQLWGFIVGNLVSMVTYSLWTNWMTLFFTTQHRLPLAEANNLATLPHFFAYFGALGGAAISYRLIARGMAPLAARRRALFFCALLLLTTALVPFVKSPLAAAIMISISFFGASGWGVNYYAMPVDAYGGQAAFAVSLLTMAYGVLQIFVSPWIGGTIDKFGFAPVCLAASLTPLLGLSIVWWTRKER